MIATRSRPDLGPPFPAALAGKAPSVAMPTAPLRTSRRVIDVSDTGSDEGFFMAGTPGLPEPEPPVNRPRTTTDGTRPVPRGEAPRAFGLTHASGPRARDVVACERKVGRDGLSPRRGSG